MFDKITKNKKLVSYEFIHNTEKVKCLTLLPSFSVPIV